MFAWNSPFPSRTPRGAGLGLGGCSKVSWWSFKEALTLGLMHVQGQYLRASASLNAVPWAPGWLHPCPRSAVRLVCNYPHVIGVRRKGLPRVTQLGGKGQAPGLSGFGGWAVSTSRRCLPAWGWKVPVHLPRGPPARGGQGGLLGPPSSLVDAGGWENWPAGRRSGDCSLHSWGLSLGTQASGISHHVPQKESLVITNPKGHPSGNQRSVSAPGRERGPRLYRDHPAVRMG